MCVLNTSFILTDSIKTKTDSMRRKLYSESFSEIHHLHLPHISQYNEARSQLFSLLILRILNYKNAILIANFRQNVRKFVRRIWLNIYVAFILFLIVTVFNGNLQAKQENNDFSLTSSYEYTIDDDHLVVFPDKNFVNSLYVSIEETKNLLKKNTSIRDVTIKLSRGEYRLTEEIVLTSEFIRRVNLQIIGVAKETVITGAISLSLDTDITNNIDGIYEIEIPPNAASLLSLPVSWDADTRHTVNPPIISIGVHQLHSARWPNQGFVKFQKTAGSDNEIALAEAIPLNPGKQLSLQGFLKHDWSDSRIEGLNISRDGKTIKLNEDEVHYGIGPSGRVILDGRLEFLDADLEYYFSKENSQIYLNHRETEFDLKITMVSKLISGENLQNLRVQNIIFEHGRKSLVSLSGTNIEILDCDFRFGGNVGLEVSGRNNIVSNSTFSNIGRIGAIITGGNKLSLDKSRNLLINNHFYKVAQRVWGSTPAIDVYGVGNVIWGNQISNVPSLGIWFTGNDHIIAYNKISNFMEITGDGGAIYGGRDWTSQGTIIWRNKITNSMGIGDQGATAIYLDDQLSGTLVAENKVGNVYRGILIGGGKDNLVLENIVVANICLSLDARGLTWQKEATEDEDYTLQILLNRVPVNQHPYSTRYPNLAEMRREGFGVPRRNIVQGNLGFCENSDISPLAAKYSVVQQDFGGQRFGSFELRGWRPNWSGGHFKLLE